MKIFSCTRCCTNNKNIFQESWLFSHLHQLISVRFPKCNGNYFDWKKASQAIKLISSTLSRPYFVRLIFKTEIKYHE